MSKTLADTRTDTRMLLDEAIAADWSVVQVDAAINYAYHEMVTATMDVYEDYYLKTTTFNSTADRQEYGVSDGMPSDFFKIRRVEINYDTSNSNSSPNRAFPASLDDVARDLGNTTIGVAVHRKPIYYLIGQGTSLLKLGFIPVPDETGTNAIKIWYIYTPADLSAATDELDIPYVDRYTRYVSYGAAGDLLRKGQQEEVVARQYRAEFEVGLEKMKQELEDRKADDVKGVTDVVGLDLAFDRTYTI